LFSQSTNVPLRYPAKGGQDAAKDEVKVKGQNNFNIFICDHLLYILH